MILKHSIKGVALDVDLRDRHAGVSGVAQFFDAAHLRAPLRDVSQRFTNLAVELLNMLPDSPELTKMLDDLLGAKDRAVRCALLKMRQAEEG